MATPQAGSNRLRLSNASSAQESELGVLSNLLGTWVGNHGWNIVAVPDGEPHKFTLLVQPYVETITFSAGGAPAPNRGGLIEQFVGVVTYDLRVTDKVSDVPLHLENGIWMYLADVVSQHGGDPPPPIPSVPFHYGRMASIPHGNTLLALGNVSHNEGPPRIPNISTMPTPIDGALPGYVDDYMTSPPGVNVDNPNETLRNQIKDQKVLKTTTLALSSANNGGIHNIPFIKEYADCSLFECVYWIEEVKDEKTGSEFLQLQYSQTINLDFFPQFKDPSKLITWPHVNINTLVKQ